MLNTSTSKADYIVRAAKLCGVENVEIQALKSHLDGTMENQFIVRRNKNLFKLYEIYRNGNYRPFTFNEQGEVDLNQIDFIIARKIPGQIEFGRNQILLPTLESYISKKAVSYSVPEKFERITELNDFLLPQIALSMGVDAITFYRSRFVSKTGDVSTTHLTKNFLGEDEVFISGNRIIRDSKRTGKRETKLPKFKTRIRFDSILESTNRFIDEHYKKYGIPKTELEETKENIRRELIKQAFVNKFFVNDNESLTDWGLIEDVKTHKLRIAPMTRFTYCAGVKDLSGQAKHVVLSFGKEDIRSFMAEFGKEAWFRQWVKSKAMKVSFEECVARMEVTSRVFFSEKEKAYYKFFFDNMREEMRVVDEANYDKDAIPKRNKLGERLKTIRNGLRGLRRTNPKDDYGNR